MMGEQDMRKMGGLKKFMPYTHAVFLVGALSLAGVPPFSGFWSKDGIIAARLWQTAACWESRYAPLALVGALLTGAYTFRLYYLVFHGEPSDLVLEHGSWPRRGSCARSGERGRARRAHAHGEGPLSMLIPVGSPRSLLDDRGVSSSSRASGSRSCNWIDSVSRASCRVPRSPGTTRRAAIAVLLAGMGIWLARDAFRAGRELVVEGGLPRKLLEHKLYFDELYEALVLAPVPAHREPAPREGRGAPSSRARSVRSGTASAGRAATPPGSSPVSCAHTSLVVAVSVIVLVVVFTAVR